MTIIKKLKLIIAAGLLAVSMNASAGFIKGSISMSGNFDTIGGSGMADATGIQFPDNLFSVDEAIENFAAAGIEQGDIVNNFDFSFNPLSPGTPIFSIGGFSLALDTVTVDFQSNNFILLSGTGYLSGPGFFDTTAYWVLSANNVGGTSNLSYGVTAVSEPATLALVGLGFIGLAVARRRSK